MEQHASRETCLMQQLNEHDLFTQPGAPSIPAGTPPGQPIRRIRTAAIVALVVLLAVVFGSGLFAGWDLSSRSSGGGQPGSTPAVTNPPVTVSGNTLDAIREAAVEKVRAAVVQVNVITASGEKLGSGVILDSQGFIVTNNHVIADAERIQVTLYDGTLLAAQLIGTDQLDDLAVVKVSTTVKLTAATLGD